MNLPKETKDLYIENYKTLMKEIKDDTNRWRNKCFNFKMFQSSLRSFILISNLILNSEIILLHIISLFKKLLSFVLWPRIYLGECFFFFFFWW